jgi:hypothetical protein
MASGGGDGRPEAEAPPGSRVAGKGKGVNIESVSAQDPETAQLSEGRVAN